MANNLAELNVVIGGNVKPLQDALGQAKTSIANFASLTKSVSDLQPFSRATAESIRLAKSIGQLDDALVQLKIEQRDVFDPKEVVVYNNAIAAVKNQIKSLTTENTQAATSAASIGKSLTSGLGVLRQVAYILPGIGIAGIFNIAGEAIVAAASSLKIFGQQSEVVTEAIKAQNDALGQAAGNVTKELTNIQALVQAGRDETLTREQRNNAIKELQRIYPGVLDSINLENISSQNTTKILNTLTDAIVRKSKAEAISNLISKTQASIFEQQNKKLEDQLSTFDKLKAAALGGPFGGGTGAIAATTAIQNQSDNLKDLNGLLDGYVKQLNAVVVEEAKAGDFELIKPDTAKSVKTVADILDDLRNKLRLIGQEEGVFGSQLNPDRVSAIKSALTALLNIGVSATSTTVQNLIAQLDALNDKIAEGRAKINPVGGKVEGDIPEAPNIVPSLIAMGDAANKEIEKNRAKGEAAINDLGAALSKTLSDVFDNLLIGVGDSIGNLLSGKGNPFEQLGKILGQSIKALGAQLIKLGGVAKGIQLAIGKLLATPAGPFLVIAGGIALEAIGSAISNLSVTPHAEGGIFTQPTMIGSHLFGEKGPEALIPLNRLQSMMGGMNSANHIEITGHMVQSYNGVKIMFERADRYTRRNYGDFNR